MKPFLQLHLQSNNDPTKAEAPNLPRLEREEPKPQAPSKRFSKFVKSTAHKAASHTGRGGMFTK